MPDPSAPKASDSPNVPPELRPNAADYVVGLLRSSLGAVPLAGPFLSELVSFVIPQQRDARFAAYLAALAARLEETCGEVEAIARALKGLSPEQVALFENGARSAVRALTSERVQAIGRIVADGLTTEAQAASSEHLILDLLDVLTDADISRLHGMTQRGKTLGELRAERVGKGLPADPVPVVEPTPTTAEEFLAQRQRWGEAHALDAYEPLRLVRLGVLAEKIEIQPIKRTLSGVHFAPPAKSVGYQLTPMALLVLGRLAKHGAIPP